MKNKRMGSRNLDQEPASPTDRADSSAGCAAAVTRGEAGGRTGAGLLLGELVDKDADAERVRGLGGDEEVVVVVDDEADEDERGHAGDHGQEGLHLGRLPPHPRRHRAERPLRPPHRVFPPRSPRVRTTTTSGRRTRGVFSYYYFSSLFIFLSLFLRE